MKKVITLIILSFLISFSSNAGEITLEGVYQGKNLYIMNPFAASGVGFCIFEVTVNGQVTTDEINSSAFEIDLTVYQFTIGDKLIVKIKYKENCQPKVLNPEVLKPKSTFNISAIKVTKDETLTWTSTNESGSLPYSIEQFRWNKWVKLGVVDGKGNVGSNQYSFKVNAHSGANKYRVKQVDYTKKPRYSKEVSFRSMKPEVTYTPIKPTTEIVFSAETMYEIYDYYGNLVLKGKGSKIDISNLKKDDYFLNYDTKTETFKKR
jgi:hypothetical protein